MLIQLYFDEWLEKQTKSAFNVKFLYCKLWPMQSYVTSCLMLIQLYFDEWLEKQTKSAFNVKFLYCKLWPMH